MGNGPSTSAGSASYYGNARLPADLLKADRGTSNTSSVNGFWASVGPTIPHTAYSAAKFAVKGFSEALPRPTSASTRPHIKCSSSCRAYRLDRHELAQGQSGNESDTMNAKESPKCAHGFASMGVDVTNLSDGDIARLAEERARASSRTRRPSAAQAAKIILDGVKA